MKDETIHMLPPREAADRVRRLQAWMRKDSVDAVFIFQNADLYFFSGTIQRGLLVIPCSGDPVYLVNKSMTRAESESAWKRLVPLPRMDDIPKILEAEEYGPFARIGLEMDVLPADYYLRMLRLFPETEFLDASKAIRTIRMIKSPYETEQIRKASQMLDSAWQHLPDWIRPGATELEILAQMEQHLRLQGHQGILRTRGFNYEVGYGAFSVGDNACFPTSFPGSTGFKGLYPAISNTGSRRRLEPGEPLMVDIAGGYGGYLADAARTFSPGPLPPDMRQAHAMILDLNREIESMLKPGTECSRICNYAFEKIGESPYARGFMGVGDNYMKYIGHGIGLELDEWPVLAPKSDAVLASGMVLAIEPKIFFPGRGGVGIENMYRITDTGFEKLTPFDEDIIVV
ncbi:MAG: aminopeptidase P family protein [Acidobacteria bacterium]|nr:aminopeptidase P family protein [Acidobacteriota bacterium]